MSVDSENVQLTTEWILKTDISRWKSDQLTVKTRKHFRKLLADYLTDASLNLEILFVFKVSEYKAIHLGIVSNSEEVTRGVTIK